MEINPGDRIELTRDFAGKWHKGDAGTFVGMTPAENFAIFKMDDGTELLLKQPSDVRILPEQLDLFTGGERYHGN